MLNKATVMLTEQLTLPPYERDWNKVFDARNILLDTELSNRDKIEVVWVHDPVQNMLRCDARLHIKRAAFARDIDDVSRKQIEKQLKDQILSELSKCLPSCLTEKPKPRCGSILVEGDTGRKCLFCGSSLKRKWLLFKTDKCIQPECQNYYFK